MLLTEREAAGSTCPSCKKSYEAKPVRFPKSMREASQLLGFEVGGYRRRIRIVSICCAVPGAVVGAILSIRLAGLIDWPPTPREFSAILIGPFGTAGIGALIGFCLACAVAPRDFLEGATGQACMEAIGTKSVAIARSVCWLLAAIFTALLSLIAWYFYFSQE